LDLGQFIANYLFFQAGTSLFTERYKKIEDTLNFFFAAYIEAFEIHSDEYCKTHNTCLLPDARNAIIAENMRDAVGFIGWWTLSLCASCPVDVLPLPTKTTLPVQTIRMNHLKMAVAMLVKFASGEPISNMQEILSIVKLSRQS